MENLTVNWLMSLIKPLSIENKLEIISKISNSLKGFYSSNAKKNKEKLLAELNGVWSKTDSGLVNEIYESRSISTRDINLD